MDDRSAGNAAGVSAAEFENGLKNHYYLNKRMTLAAFETEQEYHVRRRRLLSRAIHGWGIVQGFEIDEKPNEHGHVRIGAGLALDDFGRELVLVEAHWLAVSDMWSQDTIGKYKPDPKETWVLVVHYDERNEQPIPVSGPCNCEPTKEWELTRETVRFSLEPKYGDFAPETYPTCDAPGRQGVAGDRGPHDRLCGILTDRKFEPSDAGLPLAHVVLDVGKDACDRPTVVFKEIRSDACAIRRLVIGNEMLYDLIRGRDLTYITEVEWQDWYRQDEQSSEENKQRISWEQFSSFFPVDADGVTKFTVTFSAPIQKPTVDCFAITIITFEKRGGWGEVLRVPMRTPICDADSRKVTLVVDPDWMADEIHGRKSELDGGESLIEIAVRGDFILDCCGQAVDASAFGPYPPPSGNGSPGGTFLSCFRVAKRS